MSIEWKGLVDFGGQLNEENVDKDGNPIKSSKALVIMLVSINGNIKAPVAYHLSNSLSGLKKSILIKIYYLD